MIYLGVGFLIGLVCALLAARMMRPHISQLNPYDKKPKDG